MAFVTWSCAQEARVEPAKLRLCGIANPRCPRAALQQSARAVEAKAEPAGLRLCWAPSDSRRPLFALQQRFARAPQAREEPAWLRVPAKAGRPRAFV